MEPSKDEPPFRMNISLPSSGSKSKPSDKQEAGRSLLNFTAVRRVSSAKVELFVMYAVITSDPT
jgi:hypothetical protein